VIFRLYFVDTPEEEHVYADRIAEQAAYFGITPDAAIQIGREASLVRQASGAGEKGFPSASMSCAVFIDASRLSK
jgi:hypothetical protein